MRLLRSITYNQYINAQRLVFNYQKENRKQDCGKYLFNVKLIAI